jgi:hypothetical protein
MRAVVGPLISRPSTNIRSGPSTLERQDDLLYGFVAGSATVQQQLSVSFGILRYFLNPAKRNCVEFKFPCHEVTKSRRLGMISLFILKQCFVSSKGQPSPLRKLALRFVLFVAATVSIFLPTTAPNISVSVARPSAHSAPTIVTMKAVNSQVTIYCDFPCLFVTAFPIQFLHIIETLRRRILVHSAPAH